MNFYKRKGQYISRRIERKQIIRLNMHNAVLQVLKEKTEEQEPSAKADDSEVDV